jgi:hypothetical protein
MLSLLRADRRPKRKDQMTMVNLVITGLHHDTNRKRSIVYVRWQDDAEKNLGLIVPFGCRLEDAREEATKAVQALAAELVSATVTLPDIAPADQGVRL